MLIDKYKTFINAIQMNANIRIDEDFTQFEIAKPSSRLLGIFLESIKVEGGIIMDDSDLEIFQITSTSLSWESRLKNVKLLLTGGCTFNGLTDALTFYSDFWKGAFSLAPDVDVPEELKHFEKLGWFEKRADGNGDNNRGCFIKQPGHFPPPIVFYRSGWYVKLDMNLEEYLLTMFENYAVSGWQFFYIEITDDIPRLEEVLEEMRVACEQLPLLFPDKDWSYHINKYDETKRKLGK